MKPSSKLHSAGIISSQRGVLPCVIALLLTLAIAAGSLTAQPTGYRDPNQPYAFINTGSGTVVSDFLLFKPVFFTGLSTDAFVPSAWSSPYVDMSTYANGIPNDPEYVNLSGTSQIVVNGTTFNINYGTVVVNGVTYFTNSGSVRPLTRATYTVPLSTLTGTTVTTIMGTPVDGSVSVNTGTTGLLLNYVPATLLILGYKTTDGSYVTPDASNVGAGAADRMKPYVGNGTSSLQLNFHYNGTGEFIQRVAGVQYYDSYTLDLKGNENGRYILDFTGLGTYRWTTNDNNNQGTGIAGPSNILPLNINVGEYSTLRMTGAVNSDSLDLNTALLSYTRIALTSTTSVLDCSKIGTNGVVFNSVNGVPGSRIILPDTSGWAIIIAADRDAPRSFSNQTSYVYSDISGVGGLTANGGGHVYLWGNNTYSGNTTVSNGALFINSGVKGNVIIGSAFLGGIGTIGGDITTTGVQGFLSPGERGGLIGQLTVGGNMTISMGDFATLIDIQSATVHDRIQVNGQVTLNGILALQVVPGYRLEPGDYQVITSNNAITVDDNLSVITPGSLTVTGTLPRIPRDPRILEVTLFQKPFSTVEGLVANVRQGAELVDKLLVSTTRSFGGGGDTVSTWLPKPEAVTLVGTLNAITGVRTLNRALNEITPTAHRHWFANAIAVSSDLVRRLEERNSQPLERSNSKWAVFGSVSFLDTTMPELDGAETVRADTTRFIGGIDYYATSNLTVSGYVSVDDTDAKVDPLGGTGTIKGNTIGLYMDYRFGKDKKWRLDATALYGEDDYDTDRSIMLTGLGTYAHGKTSGERFGLALNLSRSFELPSMGALLRPYVGLQYIEWNAKAFDETGATFPLHVDAQDATSLIARLGLQYQSTFKLWKRPVRLLLSGGWQFELEDTERALTGKFAGETYKVVYGGAKSNGYTVRMGLEYDIFDRLTATVSIGREDRLQNFDNVSYYGSLSFRF